MGAEDRDIPLLNTRAAASADETLVRFLYGNRERSLGAACLPKLSPALGVLFGCLLITMLAAAPGIGSAFDFASATVNPTSAKAFAPTDATPRPYMAYEAFNTAFPRWLAEDNEVFFIQSSSAPVVSARSAELCAAIISRVSALGSSALIDTVSYYSALGEGLPEVAKDYVATSNTSMVLLLQVNTTDVDAVTSLVTESITIADDLNATYSDLSVILTGRLTTAALDTKSTGMGFALGDGIGLPFIVLIFLWRVKSYKLLLLPAFALCSSLIWSYAVGHALCTVLPVPSFQPNIMLFLCLAFSIDYSFFMLTRFQEERLVREKRLDEAVVQTLRHGGSVVVVSGGLLCLTWVALAFFPVDGLNAIGYCSAITVLFCVASNLLITPCMLLAFPDFFSSTAHCCCSCCTCCCTSRARTAPIAVAGQPWNNCYYKLATVLTRLPISLFVPLVVYGLMAWGASALSELSLSLGVQFTASNTSAAQAYALVQSTPPFSQSGIFESPFAILAQPGAGSASGLFTDEYFSSACSLAQALVHVSGVVPFSLQGIAFSLTVSPPDYAPTIACRSAADALALIKAADAPYLYTLRQLSNVGAQNATTTDYLAATASTLTFAPGFNPFSSRSVGFVDDLYTAIDDAAAASSLTFSLFHPVVTAVAAEQYTVARLPWVLGGTLAVCFALIALNFRAAVVPIKLLLTVALPIAFVFGLTVRVYQDGALNWLGIDAFKSDSGGGVSWLLPASTIFLLTGLALDCSPLPTEPTAKPNTTMRG